MAKLLYQYNEQTCRYEPYRMKGKALRLRVLAFLITSMFVAIAAFYITIHNFESVDEMVQRKRNEKLKREWNKLQARVERAKTELATLIEKDDHNYRVILDSHPLDPTIREAGIGGSEKLNVAGLADLDWIREDLFAVEKLKHQIGVEKQSYAELEKILDQKMRSWATRPAIQPIDNRQLDRLHLTYGSRLHPIFKVWKDHKGLDFAAPHGTPVYATGDGVVKMAYFSGSYGNVVYLAHGTDFETRYAHLARYAVTQGQRIKRGDVIGYVGTTGHSVAPHLHYEILFKGEHVNPINFFQRDLSNAEYQKLIKAGSKNTNSLD